MVVVEEISDLTRSSCRDLLPFLWALLLRGEAKVVVFNFFGCWMTTMLLVLLLKRS